MTFNIDKMISLFIKALPPSGLAKFLEITANNPNIVPLSVGEPDFDIPAPVRQACIDSLLHQNVVLCANITAQYGAIAALKYCANDMHAMVAEYEKRRQIMIDGFKDIGLPLYEPEGAFYVFPCIKQTGLTSMEFVEKLLEEEEVLVIPGSSFGASGEGFIRCSYAYSEDNLREALKRIAHFIKKYSK